MTTCRSCYLAAAVGFLIGSFTMWIFVTQNQISTQSTPTASSTNIYSSTNAESIVMTESIPRRLTIPAVNIDTAFTEPIGINGDNSVAVPDNYEQVGWYKYGPTPGEYGPAVILGHVDSFEGPAVFYNLKQVSIGDEVFITRNDNTTAIFTVTETEDLSQTQFPTEKVYGDLDYAGLRLITCTGVFSHTSQRYSHNLIIYAELTRFE
jgi:LPXTG-site transpeptidase (sortase) family protein